MDDNQRGLVQNSDAAKQLYDFTGLKWGTITPTDVDAFIDFGNKVFVIIEYKFGDTEMPDGQRWALERLVNAVLKPCILIHATHSTPLKQDIDGANAIVVRVYWKGQWRSDGKRTVKQAIDYFLTMCHS